MIYDCFIFDDELMMLDIRLNTLADVVDKFILVEGTHTFTGKEKELCYLKHQDDPALVRFKDKIIHVVHQAKPMASAWANETSQRNAIMDGLKQVNMQGDDIVFLCDLDEIWRPELASKLGDLQAPSALVMDFFYYAFNCSQRTKGAMATITRARDIVQPQSLRGIAPWRIENAGWHFSYLATPEQIREKLLHFSHTEYSGPPYSDIPYIIDRIRQRKSLFDDGQFTVVPLDAPDYVIQNRERFAEFIF